MTSRDPLLRPSPRAYVGAAALVVLGALLRWGLEHSVGRDLAFIYFLPFMVLAAVRGGLGPGLLVCLGSNALTFWKVDGGAWLLRSPWVAHVQPLAVSVAIDGIVLSLCVRLRESRAAAQRFAAERDAAARNTESIVTSITGCFFSLDDRYRFTYINPEMQRLVDRTAAEMLGAEVWAVFPQLCGGEPERLLRRAMEQREAIEVETPGFNSPLQSYEVKICPSPLGVSVYFRDVTERRRTAEALEAQDSLLRLIAQSSPVLIGYIDTERRYRFVNPRYAEWFGRPIDEIRGHRMEELFRPETWSVVQRYAESALHGDAVEYEAELVDAGGGPRWMHAAYVPDRGPDGSVRGAVVAVIDETARKRAEDEVVRGAERYRSFIQTSSEAIWRCETDDPAPVDLPVDEMIAAIYRNCYLAECNDAMARLYGFERASQFTGARVSDWMPRNDPQNDAFLRAFVTGGFRLNDAEAHHVDRQGNAKILLVSLVGTIEDGRLKRAWGTLRDVTEQRRVAAALRESEYRLRLALEAGQCGVWEWNVQTDTVTWSDQVYAMHGLQPGEFGGTVADFKALIHPDDVERVSRAIQQSLKDGSTYSVEFRTILPHEGAVRWLSTTGRATFDHRGEPHRLYGATTDVTARRRHEDEREALLASERLAREESDRANRIKDDFLATLSHELRTPLNAILGWAQLLRMGAARGGVVSPDPEDLTQGLETIERNARAQTQIIEDLLDMSRIVSGKLRLEVLPVDLAHVMAAAVEAVRPAAEAKGITLQKTVGDVPAGRVRGDAGRLQQVLWNLLNNAMKFTPRGGTVIVRAALDGDRAVAIRVSDNGQGIKPGFLPYVFERFRQADSSTTRQHGGLGLGLAIVKQIVEMHGGTVSAHSDGEGRGATFTVTLPSAPAEAVVAPVAAAPLDAPEVSVEAALPPSKLRGVRVLVVDDEPDARDLLKRVLEECEADVQTAASASEGLQALSVFCPDVLVSDIGMPGQDGYEFIRRVRSMGSNGGGVPAAALTAFARSEDRTRALVAGYQVHVPKPVQPAELVATVASLAGRATGPRDEGQ